MEHPTSKLRKVRVFLGDHTGNNRRTANVAVDVPVGQLTEALVSVLALPMFDPEGRRVAYHLAIANRQLTGNKTLRAAGVVEGAEVTLLPEPVAGGAPS